MKYYERFLKKYTKPIEGFSNAITLKSEVTKVTKVTSPYDNQTFDTFVTSFSRQTAEKKDDGNDVCAWCGGALSLETYDVLKVFYCSLGCGDVRRVVTCTDEQREAFENEIIDTATPNEICAMCDAMDELRAMIMLNKGVSDDDAKRRAEAILFPAMLDNCITRRKIMCG